jgi:hypothetical protein
MKGARKRGLNKESEKDLGLHWRSEHMLNPLGRMCIFYESNLWGIDNVWSTGAYIYSVFLRLN